jgi:hypothetical protein
MSMHPAIALVDELRRRGVELTPYPGRDRIRFRPRSAATSEDVELLRRHRGIVLALLQEESLVGSPKDPTDKTDKRLDPVLLSVLSVFPGARLMRDDEPWPREVVPILAEAESGPRPCRACGCPDLWSLRTGGPWVCSRCHPSFRAEEEIHRLRVTKGGGRP